MNKPQPSPDNTVELSDTRKQVRHFIKAHKAFDKYPETVILENSLVNYINQYAQQANLTARRDELHNLGESMLTQKGLMWIIARNQELKDQLKGGK